MGLGEAVPGGVAMGDGADRMIGTVDAVVVAVGMVASCRAGGCLYAAIEQKTWLEN